ncbi:HprK-related kinase A [Candidatus Methylomicrobium oryzae]|uniref:HprK-related kinase A n=1 Tax=Candidatus Methylomicrobium oryzae TaxID=2802053 RepID=UPI0030165644
MVIGNYNKPYIIQRLSNEGFILKTGPFSYRVKSCISSLADHFFRLYHDFEIVDTIKSIGFSDFHTSVEIPSLFRKHFRQQAQFYFDGASVFQPVPYNHSTAMLEWGMNWCISAHINTYLIIHAAVLEKQGFAVVLPAPPGSGKSTLCAALMSEGWRLLSDELTLIRPDNANAVPVPRPVSLKNQSIEIIRNRYPQSVFGVVSSDTAKGTVSHLKPTAESVRHQMLECPIAWVIFPKYLENAPTSLIPHTKGHAFLDMASQSFNYSKLGETGFNILKQVIDRAACYRFEYSNLDEAMAVFDELKPYT